MPFVRHFIWQWTASIGPVQFWKYFSGNLDVRKNGLIKVVLPLARIPCTYSEQCYPRKCSIYLITEWDRRSRYLGVLLCISHSQSVPPKLHFLSNTISCICQRVGLLRFPHLSLYLGFEPLKMGRSTTASQSEVLWHIATVNESLTLHTCQCMGQNLGFSLL